MDTDFVHKIETKDFYKDIAKDRQTGHYQDHSLAERESSMRVGIEVDPGCGVPPHICATNVPKCGKGVQGKKHLWVKNVWSKMQSR